MSLLYILLGIVRAVNSALSDGGLLYVFPFPPSSETKTMALSATLLMLSSQEIKASREEKGSIETRTDWQEFDICCGFLPGSSIIDSTVRTYSGRDGIRWLRTRPLVSCGAFIFTFDMTVAHSEAVKEEGKLEVQRKKQKGDAVIPGQESFGTGLETIDLFQQSHFKVWTTAPSSRTQCLLSYL
ncbi:hypothetical protein C8J56DRAFT_897379 [Mycena floridula]|nr:hypothetical protein C8J56DRAFT_897379 [Mycena floridula]